MLTPFLTDNRKVVSPFTPCHREEPVIGVDFAHACRDARVTFRFQFSQNFKISRGSISIFFPAKNRPVVRGCPCQALNGWTVCRFHGARGGASEGKRNGNYRHGARTKETMELQKLINHCADALSQPRCAYLSKAPMLRLAKLSRSAISLIT